ncbi:MAG TPA: hypothetical protein DCS05_02480 [Nitrospiraceae bacterium]|nr:hypothetical protein [Nitrospiraceae bacterium]
MKSYEAIEAAVNRKTNEHAKALHLSSSLVHKWTEPSTDYTDSGSLNPLDRIETVIQTALNLGVPTEAAQAPIQYLEERFGRIGIPVPQYLPCTKQLSQELIKTISEFSDLARAASSALEDGVIRKSEASDIAREGWDLVRQVVAFIEATKRAGKINV